MESQGNKGRDKIGQALKLQAAKLILLISVGKEFMRKYWMDHRRDPSPRNQHEDSCCELNYVPPKYMLKS